MKTKHLLLIAIVLLGLTATSCKKEKGCTNSTATNYSSTAEQDDGSCQFEGSIVFWYDKANATFLVGDGATALKYYVDGALVGSSAASVYYTGAPNCGQSSSVTVKKNLGSSTSKSFSYSVIDQTGFEYYKGSVTFQANTCTSYQLK